MAFIKRFGGWRPVQMEEGVGRLRAADGRVLEPVEYRFEVWHQMVDGFPGPYRSEGRVSGVSADELRPYVGREVVLELGEDGRALAVRLEADGTLLAHQRPADPQPVEAAPLDTDLLELDPLETDPEDGPPG